MRYGFAIALAFIAPVLAAPAGFSRDPVSVYTPSSSSTSEYETATTAPSNDACADVCGMSHIDKDGLCSDIGLSATLECAVCIDTTWPETSFADSALAEYERIVESCHATEQVVMRGDEY